MKPLLQPRRPVWWKIATPAAVILAAFAWSVRRGTKRPPAAPTAREAVLLRGETMGSEYHIRMADPGLDSNRVARITDAFEAGMAEANRQMSTYDPDSEVSRFNRAAANQPAEISAGLAEVVRFAMDLAAKSGGAFNPTVGPLVNLWGFGPKDRRAEPPPETDLRRVMQAVGYRHVTLDGANRLTKDADGVVLDLGAVGQGRGVDVASQTLRAHGVTNFFVEIGGEVLASGVNASGEPWRIGIDRPLFDAVPGENLQGVLHLTNLAVSTSGDYRNYFRAEDGQVYAHIMDPRQGMPVRRVQTSVSILAADCMTADGLATALFVLGPEEGLPWLTNAYPGTEALFVIRQPDGSFREQGTPGFSAAGGYRRSE